MAISVVVTKTSVVGDVRMVLGTWTGDSAYPTGGYPVTAADVGLVDMDQFQVDSGSLTHIPYWDRAAGKIVLAVRATGAQLGDGLTASSTTGTFVAIGR